MSKVQIKTKWIDNKEIQYIELQRTGVHRLELLIQELLLLPASEAKNAEEIEHPLFNKKNIKDKFDLTISSIQCLGGEFLAPKNLEISFPPPYGKPLQKFSEFLNKKGILHEIPWAAGHIKISGDDIDTFVALLGGTKIDSDREFKLYHTPLPKNHKEIFDKENIRKACSLSAVSQVEYNENFNQIIFVKIQFNNYQWESAIKLTNLLNKIGVIHEKYQYNYETSITISGNGMPLFINLLIKASDLITSEFEEKKSAKKENRETIGLPKFDSKFSGVFSEKRPVDITIKAVEKKFGKKIAGSIEEIDLFDYFSGFIKIRFYKSNSDEIKEFCDILKKNAIAYDKSGPEKRTIFIESQKACKELESLLLPSEPGLSDKRPPEPSINNKKEKTFHLTKESISIAFDLNLENICSIQETDDNEIEIFFKQEEKISTITNLESTLACDDIFSLYSKVKGVFALSQVHCIKIKSDDNPKFVQLVQKKCQEKIANLLQPSPGKRLQIEGID